MVSKERLRLPDTEEPSCCDFFSQAILAFQSSDIRRDSIADDFSVCFKVQTLLQLLVCKARWEEWGMRLFYSKG